MFSIVETLHSYFILDFPSACYLLLGEVVLSAIWRRHLGTKGGRGRRQGWRVQENPKPTTSSEENGKNSVYDWRLFLIVWWVLFFFFFFFIFTFFILLSFPFHCTQVLLWTCRQATATTDDARETCLIMEVNHVWEYLAGSTGTNIMTPKPIQLPMHYQWALQPVNISLTTVP